MSKPLSEQVREYAKKSGLSAHRIAIEARLDRMIVYRFLKGSDILTRNLDAIADVLGLKITAIRTNKKI